jgi:hypothetical protein
VASNVVAQFISAGEVQRVLFEKVIGALLFIKKKRKYNIRYNKIKPRTNPVTK